MANRVREIIIDTIDSDPNRPISLEHIYRMCELAIKEELEALRDAGEIIIMPGLMPAVRRPIEDKR